MPEHPKHSSAAIPSPLTQTAVAAAVAVTVFFAGCATTAQPGGQSAAAVGHADDFLIVDCLLPGQVRRLGAQMTYLAARQAIKTTASDCAIRGGEYVAYDRSNYQTALNVWLPAANGGDQQAQTYVGEIYEKGLGVAPDYQKAASWYRKAADQGHSRAQINLAHLYEKGLGVDRDPAAALNWYRKASGLTAGLMLDTGETAALRQELQESRRTSQDLREELTRTRQELDRTRKELRRRQGETTSMQQRWDQERQRLLQQQQQASSAGDQPKVEKLEAEIASRNAELVRQREQVARLEEDAARRQAKLTHLEQQRDQLKDVRQELERERDTNAALRTKLADAQQALTVGQTKVASEQQSVDSTRAELDSLRKQITDSAADKDRIKALEGKLATREKELARLQSEVKQLSAAKQQYVSELSAASTKTAPADQQASTPIVGPRIEIIDPPVLTTRASAGIVKTRAGTRHLVIGRVDAPNGLERLTVNDSEQPVNNQGIFESNVPVLRANVPVRVVAIDRKGQRSTLEFTFVPETQIAGSNAPEAAGNAAKVDASAIPNATVGVYHALVVGNNDYAHFPKLDTAINDAQAVGEVLSTKYRFKVTTLINGTRYQILSALNRLREQLTDNDNLLIYYAGHGELDAVNQRGHWLPVDAEPNSAANWISNIDVTDTLNVISAKHVLVIADSCYSGTLTRSSIAQLEAGLSQEAKVNWFKTMTAKRSRTVLTSGGVVPVLDAGGGDHSVFAKAVLDVLNSNQEVIEGARLFRDVSAHVAYAAKRWNVEQVPEYGPIKYAGHDFGDFVFVPSAGTTGKSEERHPENRYALRSGLRTVW
jgi:predicted  nucleic acid-binding Zn-ribbon protein